VTGVAGLEAWCRHVTQGYPGVNILNMTQSWRDGLAFCAIIHRFRPHLLDFSSLLPGQAQRNCQLAFSIAEKELDIPSLLDAGDMETSDKLDKRSILTYLSQFYHKFSHETPPMPLPSIITIPTPVPRASSRRKTENDGRNKIAESNSRPFFSITTDNKAISGFNEVQFCNRKESSNSLPCTLNYSSSNESNCDAGGDATEQNKDDCNETNNRNSGVETSETLGHSSEGAHAATADKTKHKIKHNSSVVPNIVAIKNLVFDNKDESTKSSTNLEMTSRITSSRESDSGVEQSSESSSTSSSRLSSVSPSFTKTDRSTEASEKMNEKVLMARKQGANMIIKPKRTHIITNNRITSHQSNRYSQGKRSINKSFQEAIIKFNSLSMQHTEGNLGIDDNTNSCPVSVISSQGTKQLKSQSCQTELDPSPATVSSNQHLINQHCQTEESHLSLNTIVVPSTSFKLNKSQKIKSSKLTPSFEGYSQPAQVQQQQIHEDSYIPVSRAQLRSRPAQATRATSHRSPHHRNIGRHRPMTSLGIVTYTTGVNNYHHHQNNHHHYDYSSGRSNNYAVMAGVGVYSTLV